MAEWTWKKKKKRKRRKQSDNFILLLKQREPRKMHWQWHTHGFSNVSTKKIINTSIWWTATIIKIEKKTEQYIFECSHLKWGQNLYSKLLFNKFTCYEEKKNKKNNKTIWKMMHSTKVRWGCCFYIFGSGAVYAGESGMHTTVWIRFKILFFSFVLD